jgi:DNA-binding CsgD family transcriptional regulator/tetratricopeptide (TPR) repeat protein
VPAGDDRHIARRVSSPELVGRRSELERLRASLARAREGRTSLVLIGGEAGIGKTRLIRESLRQCPDDVVILRGDCVKLGGGEIPYAPLIAALRGLPAARGAEALDALGSRARHEFGRLLPELGSPQAASPPEPPTPFSQGRLYELVLALLHRLAADLPVTLVLEDLHWADRATQSLITYLAHNLTGERVALWLTYRAEDVQALRPLRSLLAELRRRDDAELLDLAPLSTEEVVRQLESIDGGALGGGGLRSVALRAGGNPFLAEELLAAGATSEGELPQGLRDALLLRVEALTPGGQELLGTLAAAGRTISHERLAAAGMPPEPGLSAALREALGAHVVLRTPQGEFGFRHALVREAIYAELLPGEREALHRRLADTLAAQAGEPGEVAYHLEAAGDREAALTAWSLAGAEASRVYAFADARHCFERALASWTPADQERIDRASLLAAAAEAARFAGDYRRATTWCEEALGLIDPGADAGRAAALHERLGDYRFWDDEAALAAYGEALRLLGPEPSPARARVLAAQGVALGHLVRWDEARHQCEEALAVASTVGAPREQAVARTTLGLALAFLGDSEGGEAQLRQALTAAEAVGRPEDVARVYLHLGEVLRLRGRLAEALEVMVDGRAAARRLGLEGSFGRFMLVHAGDDLFRLGRWERAEHIVEETSGLALHPTAEVMRDTLAGQLAVAQGRLDDAVEPLSRARTTCAAGINAEFVPSVFAALAERALWLGDLDAARRDIDEGLRLTEGSEDPFNHPVLYALGARVEADVAEVARARGDHPSAAAARAAATRRLGLLDALLQRRAQVAPPAEALAHRAACAAEVQRAANDPGHSAWADTAARWEALGQPYPAAYARWREAESRLARRGDRSGAADALRDGGRLTAGLGAGPLRAELEGLARRARLAVEETSAPDRGEEPELSAVSELGLSPREIEVLKCITGGMTNRQIAERLFISPKTASAHVSHILTKLAATNRLEAASKAVRLGLGVDGEAAEGR